MTKAIIFDLGVLFTRGMNLFTKFIAEKYGLKPEEMLFIDDKEIKSSSGRKVWYKNAFVQKS
jgi:hypothetical protein